jgi:hypothetical protein
MYGLSRERPENATDRPKYAWHNPASDCEILATSFAIEGAYEGTYASETAKNMQLEGRHCCRGRCTSWDFRNRQ